MNLPTPQASRNQNGLVIFNMPDSDNVAYFDCDCKVMPTIKQDVPSLPYNESLMYYLSPNIRMQSITQNGTLYFAVFIPSQSRIAVMDQKAITILKMYTDGAMPRSLLPQMGQDALTLTNIFVQLGFLTPAYTTQITLPEQSEQPLVAWLHITNDCNLDCTYCYISKSQKHMSLETAKQSVDTLLRTARAYNFGEIVFKYAGGEPLLQFPLIIKIHDYIASQNLEGIKIRETILTNGVGLTKSRSRKLHALGINVTISMDGLGEGHNAQRPLRNGNPSIEYVQRGIQNAVSAGVNVALSLTVTNQSTPELAETIDWILDRKLHFNIHYYRVHAEGQSIRENQLDELNLIDNMKRVFKQVEGKLPSYSLLNVLIDYSDMSNQDQKTCVAGDSYLVISHTGNVSACQMLMMQAHGKITDADPLASIRNSTKHIFRKADEKEGCKTCEWRYWCRGGCPVQTLRETGRTDIKSPYCNIYKNLFPEVVRLEALRLIKHGEIL